MIKKTNTFDARFPIGSGHGSDAIHKDPIYSYAVTILTYDSDIVGSGLAFTLGQGNELVCKAAEYYAQRFIGQDIEEIMSRFGAIQREMADEQQFRWLGPHKGIVHLALASVTNALWDLWAKKRGVPLWKLLLDLTPEQIIATLDFSYIEDVLTAQNAIQILTTNLESRRSRKCVLHKGYPGYDTSIGWFNYSDYQIRDNVNRSIDEGFTAMKLKVGSKDLESDLRRARIVRETAGDNALVMIDANQQWAMPEALIACRKLAEIKPFWIEEPTHPDDIVGHQSLARNLVPIDIAVGEHLPNRVIFKNYMNLHALSYVQVDATRVAGVSEFIVISLMAKIFNLKVVPHVGDMGQIHQHLILFNHIAIGLEKIFLEYIPHLREQFVHPAMVKDGIYHTPQKAGASCDLKICTR